MKLQSNKKIAHIFLLFASLISLFPNMAHAWWSDDWAYRKKIILNTTASGSDIKTDLASVPVLVRLHTGNFDFLSAKDDGADLRFVSGDDTTPLKYHIEKYDALNELAVIWVQVPKLTAASDANIVWLYYGNDSASAGDDPKGSYDVNQVAVYHFGEPGAPKDYTAYANNATPSDAVSQAAASLIGPGATFAETNAITIPATPSLSFNTEGGFTFSAWIKITAPQKNALLFSQNDGTSPLVIGIDQTRVYAGTPGKEARPSAELTLNTWHHLAVTAGKRLVIYIDGVEAAAADVALPMLISNITLGASYNGEMDEAQISNIARSADWIKTAARGEGVDAKLITYDVDEQNEGGGTSYFTTTMQSVTFDGWVVIVICMAMAAVSWVVMVNKAVVIGRAAKDNEKFLASFQKLATDPGMLDHDDDQDDLANKKSPFAAALFGAHDHYQSSPIYRIYHVGIQEVKNRFGKTDPKQIGKMLTPQSIGAIRASLDAAMVRENQKLTSQMVLLTIAISGGPFLGLLGTVVGVMITFAAIAASGDVNVNAIAPGIAAALVATVAGLVVAIPALFGYNYLLSKIKNITADMQVFVDEFVHKVAENYGT